MHFNIDFTLKYFNKIDFIVNNMYGTAFAHLSLKRNLLISEYIQKLYAMLKFKEKFKCIFVYAKFSQRNIYMYLYIYFYFYMFMSIANKFYSAKTHLI